jgi:hypothetical protein
MLIVVLRHTMETQRHYTVAWLLPAAIVPLCDTCIYKHILALLYSVPGLLLRPLPALPPPTPSASDPSVPLSATEPTCRMLRQSQAAVHKHHVSEKMQDLHSGSRARLST